MSEGDVSRLFQDVFKALGVMYFRIHCGSVPLRGGYYMQLAEAGFPDWWTELGFIESKVPKSGKLSAEQVACHSQLKHAGHRVSVETTAAGLARTLRRWRREDELRRKGPWG